MKLKPLLVGSAITLAIVPMAALFQIKPLRVFSPTLISGIECPRANVCTDDSIRLDEAQKLYEEGYAKTVTVVEAFQSTPRMVFCTTQACSDASGLGQRAAEAIGNLAVATKPKWLIEGMAYSLSGDPRHPLGAPFELWRSQFETWHAHIAPNELWRAASEVR
jgi:hypothetical protein